MSKEIKEIVANSFDTILLDMIGIVALGVIVFVGLSLPEVI